MIVRAWSAEASAANFAAYVRHFHEVVLPELASIPGHAGAYLLRRNVDTHVELLVLTMWQSMEAVQKFAGNSLETAVIAPAARALLEKFDSTVRHFEVVHSTGAQ
jgi:heme-degrading monooxygenase HmoA